MENFTLELLDARKSMFQARYLFWLSFSDLDSDDTLAIDYVNKHYAYTSIRADFLRRRRHERTAAALAAAESEVARLRAALEAVAAQWPGLGCTIPEEWMSKERHYRLGFDDGRARVAVIARAALDICGEAAHENR